MFRIIGERPKNSFCNMKTFRNYAVKRERSALNVECDINIGVNPVDSRILDVRRSGVEGRALRRSMFSIFLVLSLLLNVSSGQVDLGYNDLEDPAEWTQPGGDDEDEDIPFTSQDFSRHTPEMLKLRQNYVQALWQQILQLQKDLPSDDPRSENSMPFLWQALRDKFNQGGLPNFDFDAAFPRPAVPMPPEVNLKTIMEILKDMNHQSMSPGPDFFENMNRNLHLFNVYYDNRRQFLEDEAGKLLRFLYAQNKGCFQKPGEMARSFEQPLRNAYNGHSFTAGEMQTLMFNIKNIFEGFSELRGNVGVLDHIGKRILSILHERIQDPRKEELFGVIRKLFNKYGSALSDPGTLKGSWPSLVVDLLAAVCKTPADLVKFIGNIGGMFDSYKPAHILSNEIESETENEVPDDDLKSPVPHQMVMKRNAPTKIRRKAPQMGEVFQKQNQESASSAEQTSNMATKKSSLQSSSLAFGGAKNNFGPLQDAQDDSEMSKSNTLSEQIFGPHSAMAHLFGLDYQTLQDMAFESDSAVENFKQKIASQVSEAEAESGKIAQQESSMAGRQFQSGFAQQEAAQSSSEKASKEASSRVLGIKQGIVGMAEPFMDGSGNPGMMAEAKRFSQNSRESESFSKDKKNSASFLSKGALSRQHNVGYLSSPMNFIKSGIGGIQKKFRGLMGGIKGQEQTPDDSEIEIEVPQNFKSTSWGPAGRVKGFKKRYGNEESSASSKTKRKGRRKSSKKSSNISAYKRQLDALQQLETARSQLLGTSTSSAGFQNTVAAANVNPDGGGGQVPGQGVAASSSEFEGRTDTIAAERTDVHQKLAQRERLQALQAQREEEKLEENEDVEKNTNKSTSKNTGEEEGYVKEFEETITPFGRSKGKVKGFKKSTSSETSQSSSTFKKSSNKKKAKVNEKISTLDREIEKLQEILASEQKLKATSESVRGKQNTLTTMSGALDRGNENALTTMSGAMHLENPYNRYRSILAQKLKQRSQLMQLRNKLSGVRPSGYSDFRSARLLSHPLAMNAMSRGYQRPFQHENTDEEHKLRSGAYPIRREQASPVIQRLPIRPDLYAASTQQVAEDRNFPSGAYQDAPALGLGPYPLPPQAPAFQGQIDGLRRYIPQPWQFIPQNAAEPNYQNPLAQNPLANFRSAAATSKGYNRKYGSEENESSSKTKVRQKQKAKKKSQKMSATRAQGEISADQKSSQNQLAAKTAKNQLYEKKAKDQVVVGGKSGVSAGSREAASKGVQSASSELQASKSDLKQSVKAKAVQESVAAAASEEDDESETEIEQSTQAKSAKKYGEESGYSQEYGNVASFKSARQGQNKPLTAGYRRQFGSEDSQASAYENVGGQVKGGELAQHLEQYKGNVYSPGNFKIPSQTININRDQVPYYDQQRPAIAYGYQSPGFVNPQQSQFQQTDQQKIETPQNHFQIPDQQEYIRRMAAAARTGGRFPQVGGYQRVLPDQLKNFAYQQPQGNEIPHNHIQIPVSDQQGMYSGRFAAAAGTGGGFAQAGGYQRALPGNGEELGIQNQYGRFGTFHSAFSSPMGKTKGYKKKFGSETSEESSNVKKKHRQKSSKKAAQMAAARAEASRLEELNSSHQSLLQKQAKNAGFRNKLRGVTGSDVGNSLSAVDSESAGFNQEQSMLAATKDQQNLKLRQHALQEAVQSQETSEDDEAETEIEENTSKKTAKNYGEESGYESNFGFDDLAEFQSARSSRPEKRQYRGYNENEVYLDDLQKFRNGRLYHLPRPLPPHSPLPYFMMGPSPVGPPSGPSGEMSAYRNKYGSESEERSSKLLKKQRHREATQLAKLAAARGEMDSLNEVEQSSAQEMGQNTDANAYKNRDSAGMRKRYGMYGNRRDAINARLHQRAKMYGVQKEIAAKTTETETELEKSTHEKKNKEGGEESGYNRKVSVPQAYGLHPGARGESKGFNKNFSKESSEKKSNLKKKTNKKTAKLISKITEVQRKIDILSELQASREQRVAASGEISAYSNKGGDAAYQSQAAINSEIKEIIKQKKRLSMRMSALTKQLAMYKSEISKELEHSSSEKKSKQTGEESAYDNQYGAGNLEAGNGVSGSSSGYSKKSSSQSSENSAYGKANAVQQANSLGVDVNAYQEESDQQLEQERERLQRLNQAEQVQGVGSVPQMPSFPSFDGAFQAFGPSFPQPSPGGQSYADLNMEGNSPFQNPFLSLADFRSARSNRKRIGKRGDKKLFRPSDFQNLQKVFTKLKDQQNPLKSMFGKALSSPLDYGLKQMNEMQDMMKRLPNKPEMPEMPDMPFTPFTQDKRKYLKKNKNSNTRPQKSLIFRPSQPSNSVFRMNDFMGNQRDRFSSKIQSDDMDGLISGFHKEFDLDGGDFATNTREKNKVLGGFQKQFAVGDDDFFANALKYAGHNSVSQSPFSKEVSQELSSQSQGVSANALGFSQKKVSSTSKVFNG